MSSERSGPGLKSVHENERFVATEDRRHWSGFTATARGFFTFSDGDEAGGAGLYLGVYVW